jgi:hypothetical protein
MDELDNLAIAALAQERLAKANSEPDTPLEEAARELGFDPDKIFARPTRQPDRPHQRHRRPMASESRSGVEYVVISDVSGDTWEEAVCSSKEEAQEWIEEFLTGISSQGLDVKEWRQLFSIKRRLRYRLVRSIKLAANTLRRPSS